MLCALEAKSVKIDWKIKSEDIINNFRVSGIGNEASINQKFIRKTIEKVFARQSRNKLISWPSWLNEIEQWLV